MKTAIKLSVAILIMVMSACSSDDSKEIIEEPLSERLEYEFTTETEIPNGTGELALVTINVGEDRIVIDPTKIFIEFTLDHYEAKDLTYGYVIPNDNNTYRCLVRNLGGSNNYEAQNVLSFNPNHTNVINADGNYPNNSVPQGNYKEGSLSPTAAIDTPLFSNMMGKNINGTWKFFVEDYQDNWNLIDDGNITKIKLIFDEGALEVTNN